MEWGGSTRAGSGAEGIPHSIPATMYVPLCPLFLGYYRETGSPDGIPSFSHPKFMWLILGKGELRVDPTRTSSE